MRVDSKSNSEEYVENSGGISLEERMAELKEKVEKATNFVTEKIGDFDPEIGVILGTGLGALAQKIEEPQNIPYKEVPFFPVPTVEWHAGQFVFGKIGGKKIVAMQGRFHYYEGWSSEEITLPIRVMRRLGAKILIESNAAGGLNPQFIPGDLMIITDHINLMGINPLIGPNDDTLGPRFPDMSNVYDKELVKLTEEVAREEKIKIYKGVYVGVTGPNLETAAEYRFFRAIGADAIGMSTVPEVIVAIHSGFKVLGITCITDRCLPDALQPANIEEIIRVASTSEPVLTNLVAKVIEKIP